MPGFTTHWGTIRLYHSVFFVSSAQALPLSLPIAEDGQKKPKEKPVKSQKRMEKKRKHPSPKPRKKHEKPVGEHMGGAFHPKKDGYDGYYDDVLPSDAGKLKEGPDMELVKKVSAVAGVMLLIVILCVVAMYLL